MMKSQDACQNWVQWASKTLVLHEQNNLLHEHNHKTKI
jgi:hypothetical protein